MTRSTLWGSHDALRWIAVGVLWARLASAQAPDAGDSGDCMPSREPHECAERCPSFDTCYIAEGDGRLYYRVMSERFDCDGLDCTAASTELGDYCCQRGDYAPSRGGGGGCALAPTSTGGRSELPGVVAGASLGALARLVVRRRARARQRQGAGRRGTGRAGSNT